ncbi:TrkH family potassium uptake protein [Serpentinicella alkaliphila]|uniref:Trk system potassium uptake protein TrkH n=1 Tax=Serpentinicella alkaliphila TaxID=1734049 RepID=A0A4R2TNF7_9FIRM|nr:TrkH family potassium uptake protein [Serpentinicella alkaliphila]QUH24421.1 Trk family potassium uptake protein [Serpentinicella alkaliphila]TCQ04187.1 trk system potassium uptake protein TrkH [Serpentinicella alkaliphila]
MKDRMDGFNLAPTQVLAIGFALVILVGSMLLNLPIASQDGRSIGFINALFTSASAVCVTGLVVVDTGTHWTVFGKTVILILIQVGGLGFMTLATMLAVLLGKKISLKERLLIQESLSQYTLSGVVRFTQYILLVTLLIEGLGALLLSFTFVPEHGLAKGIAYSIFHSISAFCNAGFDIIGHGRGLTPYVNDPIVNFTIWSLVILGGIGFSVIVDINNKRSIRKLSLHTKIVLVVTFILLTSGFLAFLLLEWNNPETLGNLPLTGKLMAGFFQSMTTRTAGFNTIALDQMNDASKLITIILMFIGGSPASTAGGIKTATLGVIIFTVISVIKGKEETELFKKRIPRDIVNRAITVSFISLTLVIVVTGILTMTETGFSFLEILFESTSAFGTVGLSLGITSELSSLGRLVITFLMFAGRVGPITIVFALARRQRKYKGIIKYPEGKILVG